jgi:YVTN family beta-propeller protein
MLLWLAAQTAQAQTTGATFGEVVALGGTPSDVVLDELRGRLYLVNDKANRVDIYDYNLKTVIGSLPVGTRPLAAAMSMDNAYLYVTNNLSSSLTVIDLATLQILQTVLLPSRPEGVETGFDGRVLVSMVGTVVNNQPRDNLAIFDRNLTGTQALLPVQIPSLPATPLPLQPTFIPTGRPVTTFNGKLIRTPDGRFIVGVITPANNQTYVFVYEVASGVILRNRTSFGQSSVLAMSPDGSRFMAGMTMFDINTLAILGQQNNANAPFPFTSAFNIQQSIGGSGFSPDGKQLFSAFNVAPFGTNPPPRPQSSTLLIGDASNLSIKLGIKLPESIVAKLLVTSDGSHAFGMSESGLLYLPLSRLYDYPILQPERMHVFLSVNPCNPALATGELQVNNVGKGRLTFSLPNTGSALVAIAESGLAPAKIRFTMEPGRSGVQRRAGTNIWTNAGTQAGQPFLINLASAEAINLIPTIKVYMNYRLPDQRGMIFPLPTTPNNNPNVQGFTGGNEGLHDIVLDEPRGKVYLTNSGFNRVEVFDIATQRFLDPIPVGQLPRHMAMSSDGFTLYVANTGSEVISVIDLDALQVVGQIDFPPVPRNGAAGLIYPRSLAMGFSGLQFIMSNGSLWKVIGNQAVPRPASSVIQQSVNPNAVATSTAVNLPGGPNYSMLASLDGEYVVTMSGDGRAFLYDSKIDQYTTGRTLFTNPIQGYYGPLAIAQAGQFATMNGLITNSSLTVIGGAERPGATQFTPPPQPGLPPQQTVVNTGQRHVAAIAPLGEHTFLRMTVPVRQAITSAVRDDERSTLELTDLLNGNETLAAVPPENPYVLALGTTRFNVPARQMVVDSRQTVYAITLSGLSVIPLPPAAGSPRPVIAAGARGIVNSSDGTANIRPGAFITVSGTNLATPSRADQLPAPTVLGGSCVTFSDVPALILQTAPGQIQAQVPETLRPGTYVVQVRSLANALMSDPVVLTVQRPAGQTSTEPPRPSTEPESPAPPAPAVPTPAEPPAADPAPAEPEP